LALERLEGEPGSETILGDLVKKKKRETRIGKLEGPAYIRRFVDD
jgi:hypothetical protein